MKLLLRRILLVSLLFLSIGGLSVYAYYHSDQDDVSIYVNMRDQSDDYDALFDNSNFKTFTITFEEDVFEEMLLAMETHFDLYGDYLDNTMYPVNLTYSDSHGSFTVLDVGFRTKSSTSRNMPRTTDWRGRYDYHQTSFQLQFNETFNYESGTNIHQILKTREVFNLEQLNFEYSQIYDGDNDQAMISEAFTYDLYRQAGLVVANASYGLVYLKIGDTVVPYGFFTVVEPIDSEFLKANFKSNLANEYGDLYKVTDVMTEGSLKTFDESVVGLDSDEVRYTYSLRNNSLDGTRRTFSTLESFIDHINDPVYFNDHSQDILDVDLFIRYLAIAFLAGNTDDLRYNFNNYYLYFDVYSHQATFIPFDLDASLGFGKHLDLSGNYGVSYAIDYNLDDPSPLIARIFANETYVNLYRHYLQTFIEDFFNYDDFYLMYLEAKNLYEPLLISEGHLGNRVFDTRNVYWYFTEKTTNVLNQLQ